MQSKFEINYIRQVPWNFPSIIHYICCDYSVSFLIKPCDLLKYSMDYLSYWFLNLQPDFLNYIMDYLFYWFLNLWTDSLIPATNPISIVNLQFLKLLNDYPKNLISFQEHALETSTSYQSHILQTLTSWSTPNNVCYNIYLTVAWFFP